MKSLSDSEEFFAAAEKGDIKKVATFLKSGIDPNLQDQKDWLALHYASKRGYLEVVQYFLENGANIDVYEEEHDRTVLQLAIIEGHLEMVKLLIEKGADINIKSSEDETPLDFAKKTFIITKT